MSQLGAGCMEFEMRLLGVCRFVWQSILWRRMRLGLESGRIVV